MSRPTCRELAEVIVGMLKDGQSAEKVARDIAGYVVAERRTKDIDAIMRDVMAIRSNEGIQEATATSAFKLSAEIHKDIQTLLAGQYPGSKRVILHETHDPAVVGGVRIETNDLQLDTTVKSRLQHLSNLMETSA